MMDRQEQERGERDVGDHDALIAEAALLLMRLPRRHAVEAVRVLREIEGREAQRAAA